MNVDLDQIVWDVMFRSMGKRLTVERVAQKVAECLQDDIKAILNRLDNEDRLTSIHGGGPGGRDKTVYSMRPIERRI